MSSADLDHLPICCACGTQFAAKPEDGRCMICDDPRQFIPPAGQKWTSLNDLRGGDYRNTFTQTEWDEDIWYIRTEPSFGIGQRCFLIKTPHGNVLWDCIALLDDETVNFIKSHGDLKAIVISHPHFYTTHAVWSSVFDVPIYTSDVDKEWLSMPDSMVSKRRLMLDTFTTILPDITAIRPGGHFPGSCVLKVGEDVLMIADTLFVVPSAKSPKPRPPEHTTFAFMWSIPNALPLSPDAVLQMWKVLKNVEFKRAYGLMPPLQVRDDDGLRWRLLESMKKHVACVGQAQHAIFEEQA